MEFCTERERRGEGEKEGVRGGGEGERKGGEGVVEHTFTQTGNKCTWKHV